LNTIEDICKHLKINEDLANFQDVYNPVHLYCRLKEISDKDFREELKEYQKIYNSIKEKLYRP
jgi:hypothetical protein